MTSPETPARSVVVVSDTSIVAYFATNLALDEIEDMYGAAHPGCIAYEQFSVPLEIARVHMDDVQFSNYQTLYQPAVRD